MGNKYAIFHIIDKKMRQRYKVSPEFLPSEWPLHLTLLGNFTTNAPIEHIINALINYTENIKPFEITVGNESLFGINEDILVSVLQTNGAIKELHNGLKGIMDAQEAIYDNSNFVGTGYNPHVTVQETTRLNTGQKILVGDITLVDMEPNGDSGKRRVVRTFFMHCDK